MTDALIRLTGRPKIDRDPSGLRRITRQYVVQGSAVTEGNVEDQVFLPYGTPDIEYDATIVQDLTNGGLTNEEVTGAYLVEQNIAPGQSMNEAILTRVYQELDASNEPVQIGKDQIVRGANDRLTVTRVFIVKNPYEAHYQTGRIGIEDIIIGGSTCLLGTVQSKETEVYTEFTEVYFEDGILSESVNYKYGQYPNHKLESRTLRSVADVIAPANTEGPGNGPWFRIDEKEGPGNQDYGQLGKTVRTVVFVKGEGLISKDSEVKGKPPNTVEVSTVKYITGQNGSVPAGDIPTFTRRTFEGKDEKDGWELHTIRGVTVSSDNGVVDVKVQYKYGKEPNHKLEIASAKSYGIPPDSGDVISFVYPNGDSTNLGTYVLIEEREDTTGEFDVFTSTFARGNGVISESEKKVGFARVTETVSLHSITENLPVSIQSGELARKVEILDGYKKLTVSITTDDSGIVDERTEEKHNGALFIKSIQQLGTVWDDDNTPAGYVEISIRNHRYDIYPAITKVFAKGEGEISRTTRKIGLAKIFKTVTIFKADTQFSVDLEADELSRAVDEKDGYKIVTISSRDLNANIVDERTELKHKGALTIKSITALGSTWTLGTPSGFIEISNRDHTYQEYPAITKQFAKGEGHILVSDKEDGLFTRETYVVLGEDYEAPEGAVDVSVSKEQGYTKTTFVLKRINDDKENLSLTFASGLSTTTRSRINHSYSDLLSNAGKDRKWIDAANYQETARELRKTELKDVAISYSTGIKRTSNTLIENSANTNFDNGGSVTQIARNLFRNNTVDIEKAEYKDINVSDSKWYRTTITREVENAPKDPGDLGGSTSQIAEDLYMNSSIEVQPQGYQDESVNFASQGALKVTRTTSVGEAGSEEFSISNVRPDVAVGTSIETEPHELAGQAISYEGVRKIVTTTSLGDGNLGGKEGIATQIHPNIFIHKTKESSKWSGIVGKDLYRRTYERLGVRFEEAQAYDDFPSVPGEVVTERTDYQYIPTGNGTSSEAIKKCTRVGATFIARTWTTYEVRQFSAPGVIYRQRDGVTITEPKQVPVWCKIEHQLVQTPGSSSISYDPPDATINMVVGFKDRIKDERVIAGGNNYVIRGNFSTPGEGDRYAGYTVEFCDLEEVGDQWSNWTPVNKVFATSTNLIYVSGQFMVFHQQEISCNARPNI